MKRIYWCAVLLLILGVSAQGAEAAKKTAAKGSNGKVDLGILFGKLDKNNDQKLTFAEFQVIEKETGPLKKAMEPAEGTTSAAPKSPGKKPAQGKKKGNATSSLKELQDLFAKADGDNNKSLTLEEFSKMNEAVNGKDKEPKKKKKN